MKLLLVQHDKGRWCARLGYNESGLLEWYNARYSLQRKESDSIASLVCYGG